jgi:glucose/arabinose dehydrogenase
VSENRFLRLPILLLVALGHGSAAAQAIQSAEHSFRVVTVVQGLDQPWGLALLPDGRMLVTEKPGRLRIVHNGKLESKPVAGLPQVTVHGQGGLMDVALHPRFAENGWSISPMPRAAPMARARRSCAGNWSASDWRTCR